MQPSEGDIPSHREQEPSLGEMATFGSALEPHGTFWESDCSTSLRGKSTRAHASVPASSVYQLSGKHTVWFQKDCCQLGRKVNKVKPEDCLGDGRQTTTPPEHVPALLCNSEVKPLSLVPEGLRESQDTHSRHTSLLSRKLLRQPSKSVRASRDRRHHMTRNIT